MRPGDREARGRPGRLALGRQVVKRKRPTNQQTPNNTDNRKPLPVKGDGQHGGGQRLQHGSKRRSRGMRVPQPKKERPISNGSGHHPKKANKQNHARAKRNGHPPIPHHGKRQQKHPTKQQPSGSDDLLPNHRPRRDECQSGKPSPRKQGHRHPTNNPPPLCVRRPTSHQEEPNNSPTNSKNRPPSRRPPLKQCPSDGDEHRHTPNGDKRGKTDGDLCHSNLVGGLKPSKQNPRENKPQERNSPPQKVQLRRNNKRDKQPTHQQPISSNRHRRNPSSSLQHSSSKPTGPPKNPSKNKQRGRPPRKTD